MVCSKAGSICSLALRVPNKINNSGRPPPNLPPPPRALYPLVPGGFAAPPGISGPPAGLLASTGGFPVASSAMSFSTFDSNSFNAALGSLGKGQTFGPPMQPPQRPLPPPGGFSSISQAAFLQQQFSSGAFSASAAMPGVRPPPGLPSGPPPLPSASSSASVYVSPVISETTTLNPMTSPIVDRDAGIIGMDTLSGSDSDGRFLPSPMQESGTSRNLN